MPLEEFQLKPKYDQTQFLGRIRHFFEIFNPMLLLVDDRELKENVELLKSFEKGEIKPGTLDIRTNKKLWRAKTVTEAILHPQTKEKIPWLFRFSAFLPMNIPIIAGMLIAKSVPAQLFWQWYNQSYNVAVNYCNGNKTERMSPFKITAAYFAAVSLSCGATYLLGGLFASVKTTSVFSRLVFKAAVPSFAVSVAGVSNVLMMRSNELSHGIELKSADGKFAGISRKAALVALSQVAATRAIMPFLTIFLPGVAFSFLENSRLFLKLPGVYFPIQLLIISCAVFFSLPVCIGLFPQEGAISSADLEENFFSADFEASKSETLYFNKGL